MGAESKFGKVRGTVRKRAAKPATRRGRRTAAANEAWEQTAQFLEERNDEIDCQRIVEGDGRSLRPYYDDYN